MAATANSNWLDRYGLTTLLLFAFLLTSLLVLQQQRTIESQRLLIRDLFHDSEELTQVRIKAVTQIRR